MIPEAAVEAVARAWCGTGDVRDWQRRHITKLLEAAAPHMPSMRAVSAVLALHREMECRDEDNEPVGGSYCEECKDLDDHTGERVHEIYPCLTVREITASLAGAETFTAMRDWIERTTK